MPWKIINNDAQPMFLILDGDNESNAIELPPKGRNGEVEVTKAITRIVYKEKTYSRCHDWVFRDNLRLSAEVEINSDIDQIGLYSPRRSKTIFN